MGKNGVMWDDERELKELILALFYEEYLKHGTAGHNRLMLMSKLAKNHGLSLKCEFEIIDRGQIVYRSKDSTL